MRMCMRIFRKVDPEDETLIFEYDRGIASCSTYLLKQLQ